MQLIHCAGQKWWRLWSVRIHAVMSAALAYLVASPDAAASALSALPPAMQTAMPPFIGISVFALGTFGRLVHQKKVANAPPA